MISLGATPLAAATAATGFLPDYAALDAALLDGVQLVLKSPGLAPNAPDVERLMQHVVPWVLERFG